MAERSRVWVLCCLAALLLAGSPVRAQMAYGDLDFVVEPAPMGESMHGYAEYRVFISSKSKDDTHRVTLTLPAEDYGGNRSSSLQAISRTVQVGPGLTTVVSLFQPPAPDVSSGDISVRIDGRLQSRKLIINPVSGRSMGRMGRYRSRRGRPYYGGYGGSYASVPPLVLRSVRVKADFNEMKSRAAGVGPGAGPAGGPVPPPTGRAMPGGGMAGGGFVVAHNFNAEIVPASGPVSGWSGHWLGYTRYDGIVLTAEDIKELLSGGNDTRTILQALWQYTELGGVLIVLGPGDAKERALWKPADVPVPASWKRLLPTKNGLPVPSASGLMIYQVGFGQCLVAPDNNSGKWAFNRWGEIGSAVSKTTMPWQTSRSLTDLNQSFAVVDDLGVPVKGLFVLMVLFGLALGPGNLIMLSRKKKRIWMLWTVPAISFVTCMVVFGYMVIAEGWQGHARAGGITLLDEVDHRATSLGRATFYSPLTPGDGLRFSDDTEVFIQGSENIESSSSYAMDWTQGQHLSRGWVTARVPAHFATRISESRRERLTVQRDADGEISVLNGLGADIISLWLADENNVLYKSGPIPAGARATLELASVKPDAKRPAGSPIDAWRNLYTSNDWVNTTKYARERPWEQLVPRSYLAVVDGSPFHNEKALRNAAVRETESVVIGMMADLGK